MRELGIDVLQGARARGIAIGAFSTYGWESSRAICSAAAETDHPVIVQVGAGPQQDARLQGLAEMTLQVADLSASPVGVHLDHSRDLDQVRECLELGFTSVMYDGSHLPFSENIAQTTAAVTLAHEHGAWIEGELGAIGGDEDRSFPAQAREFTDPSQAAEFVARTGVDALAVAVGNVHGTAGSARLNVDLLALLADATSIPLVLHGASGLQADEIAAAIALGVAKLNVNTELRHAYLNAVAGALPHALTSADLAHVLGAASHAVQLTTSHKILEFARTNKRKMS